MNNLKQLKQELGEAKYKLAEIERKIIDFQTANRHTRWRAEYDERYYFINSDYAVCGETEKNTCIDDIYYKTHNYFREVEEARRVADKMEIYNQLSDLALGLNDGKKIDWTDSTQRKWGIGLDNFKSTLRCYACVAQEIGQIYCLDENFLKVAKEKIGEENLKKLFE